MLEAKNSTYGGAVMNMSIYDIQENICEKVKGDIMSFNSELPDMDDSSYGYWIQNRLFGGERYIHINSKNIEFSTSFHLRDFIMSDRLLKKMESLYIADVLIMLTVYRLGQHSYYSAECQTLLEIQKKALDKAE